VSSGDSIILPGNALLGVYPADCGTPTKSDCGPPVAMAWGAKGKDAP